MSEDGSHLLEEIKSNPHWRVVIRPDSFEEERIPDLRECWDLVESCHVLLRGWDYPHIDMNSRALGRDWIASWCDWEAYREYWRFHQSGQFAHLFAFREDGYHDAFERQARPLALRPRPVPKSSPSRYLEVFWTLYTVTEIFEFATRLAQKSILGRSLSISIEMTGIKDRILFVLDPLRLWSYYYAATEDQLGKEWTVDTEKLMSQSADLARKAAVWFYERFGWMNPSEQVLADQQRKLFERRL